MPRNVSEMKSGGGDNSYAAPRPEKWGGGGTPRPPPIDARATTRLALPLGLHLFSQFD